MPTRIPHKLLRKEACGRKRDMARKTKGSTLVGIRNPMNKTRRSLELMVKALIIAKTTVVNPCTRSFFSRPRAAVPAWSARYSSAEETVNTKVKRQYFTVPTLCSKPPPKYQMIR